jgi:chaperonin cofactor prefoldin
MNKIKYLEEKITLNVLKSEKLGNDCQIDEAQQVLNECEEMREEKKKLELVGFIHLILFSP